MVCQNHRPAGCLEFNGFSHGATAGQTCLLVGKTARPAIGSRKPLDAPADAADDRKERSAIPPENPPTRTEAPRGPTATPLFVPPGTAAAAGLPLGRAWPAAAAAMPSPAQNAGGIQAGLEAPPWLPTGQPGQPFDFCGHVRRLCAGHRPPLRGAAHIDVSRLLFGITQARSGRPPRPAGARDAAALPRRPA